MLMRSVPDSYVAYSGDGTGQPCAIWTEGDRFNTIFAGGKGHDLLTAQGFDELNRMVGSARCEPFTIRGEGDPKYCTTAGMGGRNLLA